VLTEPQQQQVRQALGDELADFFDDELWSSGAASSYAAWWRQWSAHASHRGIDALHASAPAVAAFLAHMHRAGYATGSVSMARSAIGSVCGALGGSTDVHHPIVARVLAIIARKRPTRAKYDKFWEVDAVTDELTRWGDNASMPIFLLQLKVVALLALAGCMRPSDICRLRESSISRVNDTIDLDDITIEIDSPKENQGNRVRVLLEALRPDAVAANRIALCPVRALRACISRRDIEWPARQGHRHPSTSASSRTESLFRGVRPPHRPITSTDTIAGWLVEVLRRSGVDTATYSAHSFRGASASAALKRGVPIGDVMLMGRWSSRGVFEKFYRRAQPLYSVAQAVLGRLPPPAHLQASVATAVQARDNAIVAALAPHASDDDIDSDIGAASGTDSASDNLEAVARPSS